MSPGLTTERIYDVLKSQIMLGQRAAGERLDPARLARDLNASATPVRDALHQLLGERMVHAVPSHGFQVSVLSETGLRDLYAWTSDILAILLRSWRGAAGTPSVPPLDQRTVAEATGDLFDAVALALGNSEHRRAIRDTNDRLHHVRAIECTVLSDVDREIERLFEAWQDGEISSLKTLFGRYHRRRLQAVPAIVAKVVAAP